jgi:hypothetical protein
VRVDAGQGEMAEREPHIRAELLFDQTRDLDQACRVTDPR